MKCSLSMQVALAALVLLIPFWAQAAAVSLCPPDTIDAGCILMVTRNITNLPGATCPGNCVPWQAGENCDGVCYDLRAGRIEVHFAGGIDCVGFALVTDDYMVTGPAPGTPVEMVFRLRVEGTLVNATGNAQVWDEGTNVARVDFTPADQAVSTVLSIPVSVLAGESSRLHATLGASGWEGIDLIGSLEFVGPPGSIVASCQGYDQPVPTLPCTWGQVKAYYR